jgi:predicted XRE-type DNA-binding protein
MSAEKLQLVHGSGNAFRDFGHPDAEILQLKTILAARIIEVLDEQKITVRQAQEMTGYAAADFSRVRQAKLQRFTIERLIRMLGKLNQDVHLNVDVRSRPRESQGAEIRRVGKAKRANAWARRESAPLPTLRRKPN